MLARNIGRFKDTYLLWISTAVFVIAVVGHTLSWFPANIFNGIAKDLASSTAFVLVVFACLLKLHLCSEEKLAPMYIFVAGILFGIGIAFMWGISSASVIVVIASGQLLRTGTSLLKCKYRTVD